MLLRVRLRLLLWLLDRRVYLHLVHRAAALEWEIVHRTSSTSDHEQP